MLNFGPLIALGIAVVEFLLIKRESIMKVSELLSSRETAVLNAVATALDLESPEQRDRMLDAAHKAATAWNEAYLPRLIGDAAARQIMEAEVEALRGQKTGEA
ncbi:hypothetical protein D7S89_26940 [Trinickia fusca]|uniref:Uncharacterized protein n=1 Tax=Trinickia fusca TaxID=2419777 RepID=A0A494WXL7_9BURK|nr:hypothetical protein D7S89_26940 [Trinickia fusca]